MCNFTKLQKDFIREKLTSVLQKDGKIQNLRIKWSNSLWNREDVWILMITYEILNPTLRLVRGTELSCKDTGLIKIKTMISCPKTDFVSWSRQNKLNKLFK